MFWEKEERKADRAANPFQEDNEPEVLRQLDPVCRDVAFADPAEERKRAASRQPRMETQVTGQVADVCTDARAVAPTVQPEDARATTSRSEKAQEHTDRRGLADTVRSEKATDRAFFQCQAQIVNPDATPVVFAEAFDLDDAHRAHCAVSKRDVPPGHRQRVQSQVSCYIVADMNSSRSEESGRPGPSALLF